MASHMASTTTGVRMAIAMDFSKPAASKNGAAR